MPKQPISVTLERVNLLWLRGRAASRKRRSVSDALDEVVTAARLGAYGLATPRSVVGTVDISEADPQLAQADAHVATLFDAALGRGVTGRARQPDTAPRNVAPAARRRPSASRTKTSRG